MTAEPLGYELAGPTDGALACEHLSGAGEAFAELYRRYYPRLVRLCLRRTGDAYLAEDIAQETLLRALRYLSGFDTSRPMWPWLKTIATRIAYQHAQQTSRERCSDIDQEDPEAYAVESPCHRIDDQLVLSAALDRVPTRQRAALVMRYVDDWSTADSARFAGMTVPAFEQLLFRARRRLGAEYRRLTEIRRPGTLGLLPLSFATLRRLRLTARTRLDAMGLGTSAAGTGLLGLASLGVAATVLAGPAVTSPALQLRPDNHRLAVPGPDRTSAADSDSLRAGPRDAAVRRAGSATAPARDGATRIQHQVGPADTGATIGEHPLGDGETVHVIVYVETPLGPIGADESVDNGDHSTVECYNTECDVDLTWVGPPTT